MQAGQLRVEALRAPETLAIYGQLCPDNSLGQCYLLAGRVFVTLESGEGHSKC